jgi:hypothetical protein
MQAQKLTYLNLQGALKSYYVVFGEKPALESRFSETFVNFYVDCLRLEGVSV